MINCTGTCIVWNSGYSSKIAFLNYFLGKSGGFVYNVLTPKVMLRDIFTIDGSFWNMFCHKVLIFI